LAKVSTAVPGLSVREVRFASDVRHRIARLYALRPKPAPPAPAPGQSMESMALDHRGIGHVPDDERHVLRR
jgi:hypothetical protein